MDETVILTHTLLISSCMNKAQNYRILDGE